MKVDEDFATVHDLASALQAARRGLRVREMTLAGFMLTWQPAASLGAPQGPANVLACFLTVFTPCISLINHLSTRSHGDPWRTV